MLGVFIIFKALTSYEGLPNKDFFFFSLSSFN